MAVLHKGTAAWWSMGQGGAKWRGAKRRIRQRMPGACYTLTSPCPYPRHSDEHLLFERCRPLVRLAVLELSTESRRLTLHSPRADVCSLAAARACRAGPGAARAGQPFACPCPAPGSASASRRCYRPAGGRGRRTPHAQRPVARPCRTAARLGRLALCGRRRSLLAAPLAAPPPCRLGRAWRRPRRPHGRPARRHPQGLSQLLTSAWPKLVVALTTRREPFPAAC